jgi:hypothetical protein
MTTSCYENPKASTQTIGARGDGWQHNGSDGVKLAAVRAASSSVQTGSCPKNMQIIAVGW